MYEHSDRSSNVPPVLSLNSKVSFNSKKGNLRSKLSFLNNAPSGLNEAAAYMVKSPHELQHDEMIASQQNMLNWMPMS